MIATCQKYGIITHGHESSKPHPPHAMTRKQRKQRRKRRRLAKQREQAEIKAAGKEAVAEAQHKTELARAYREQFG
jgi:hypothetical protein